VFCDDGGGLYLVVLDREVIEVVVDVLIDFDFGGGVGVGYEPSSQCSPMHVMTNVWRGSKAGSFAGAWMC
jgi:hypothetical protein